jgi:hypothetical protein
MSQRNYMDPLSWTRIGIHIPKLVPGPGDKLNADPYGSRSATLLHTLAISSANWKVVRMINMLECLQKPCSLAAGPCDWKVYFKLGTVH